MLSLESLETKTQGGEGGNPVCVAYDLIPKDVSKKHNQISLL